MDGESLASQRHNYNHLVYLHFLSNLLFLPRCPGPNISDSRLPHVFPFPVFHLRSIFQVSILVGAVAERGRTAPLLLFCFVWTTLVYCVLANWVWNTGGWAFK